MSHSPSRYRSPAPTTASTLGRTPTFDIRDGAKLTRVPLDQILAVRSIGNYVEVMLADGRKPLMRSPLSAVERELGPRGFLRTHRSWRVNAKRVTSLMPAGSGDYTVELGDVTVPPFETLPAGAGQIAKRRMVIALFQWRRLCHVRMSAFGTFEKWRHV